MNECPQKRDYFNRKCIWTNHHFSGEKIFKLQSCWFLQATTYGCSQYDRMNILENDSAENSGNVLYGMFYESLRIIGASNGGIWTWIKWFTLADFWGDRILREGYSWSWCPKISPPLPSGKLTWQWKIPILCRKYIFQWSISHCYVSLPECIQWGLLIWSWHC